MKDDKLDRLKQEATRLAISWAKTGIAYSVMEDAVNKYIETTVANNTFGDDPEGIRLHRETAVLSVDLLSIYALNRNLEQRLYDTLLDIARRGVPRPRRGFRR